MKSRKCLVFVVIVASLSLSSCSGVKNPCTTNCGGGGGTASLSLTLAAVPFVPPPNTSLLSFAITINSVSLTPASGGSVVDIPLNTGTYTVDLTRLQSDSSFLGQRIATIPSGTYNQIKMGVTSTVVTYCTASSGTAGCNAGSVAQVSPGPSVPTTSSFSLTLADGQQAGLRIVFNIGNAVTVNQATQVVTAVDLGAANVLTAISLPPAFSTLGAGQLDYVEDVTGVITAATPSSVTVQTATRGPITSVITGSTLFSSNCVVLNNKCTPTVGQVASMDATLNADGTSTMLLFDPLTTTSADLIEGIVTSEATSSTQFQIVANDFVKASSSKIGGLNLGDTVNVTLAGLVSGFFIDGKLLPLTSSSFNGSNSATDIHTGQTVMVRVTAFTPRSGSTPASATADAVVLRFTRFAAAAAGAGGPQFSIGSLPPFFGFTTQPLVQMGNSNPLTYLDGYTSNGSITSGDNLGIRALYFGTNVTPSFSAAKIRKN
jgi:uncharacterized protein DUF4382